MFGMGTGVAPPALAPGIFNYAAALARGAAFDVEGQGGWGISPEGVAVDLDPWVLRHHTIGLAGSIQLPLKR